MSNRYLLVVEDDGATTLALTRLIEQWGALVCSARTVTDAARQLDHPWDCVLLDILLPDGDATRLIPQLHCASPRPRIAIASGSLEVVGAAIVAAFEPDALFQKPVRPGELLEWVNAQLHRGTARDHYRSTGYPTR